MKDQGRRRFTAEFKNQAVELALAGRPVAELAEELEVGTSLLYNWISNARTAPNAPQPTQLGSGALRAVGEEGGADELRRLREEISTLRQENLILKKAAVILGTEAQPRITR